MDKFVGLPYPLTKHPKGYFRKQSGVDQIRSDLLCLLLTNPGERVMEVDFGTPLRDVLFEANTPALAARVRQMIVDSVTAWDPRVSVTDIAVESTADRATLNPFDDGSEADHVLTVRISFRDPDDISEIQQLTLDLPLQGGAAS